MRVIQLFIPVVTFTMGYFLSNIGYKRDRKLSIIREKFEKLHHPFYLLLNELGENDGEGYVLDIEDGSVLKCILEHLIANAYLASPKGQKLIGQTRKLYASCTLDGGTIDKDKHQMFEEPLQDLFEYLTAEYIKCATALGYEIGDA